MPRPKNKSELIALSTDNFNKLFELIEGLEPTQREAEFPPGTMNRNVKDVLAHLHHWHLMMLDWYDVGMEGQKPEMPAKGHTWKTVPQLNLEIWKRYHEQQLDEVVSKLKKSHSSIMEIISRHSDEELFTKKRYAWTRSTSLGAYLISASSSHYDWALKLIKKCRKLKNEAMGSM